MHRLDRRLVLLRGKRNGAFDANQYWFETAARTRVSRSVRVHLRAGRPVVLVTPRWSRAQQFLDDVAMDLSLGDPAVTARTLNLAPLRGLTVHQAWAWIASAVAEFCQVTLGETPAWQAVSRRGFRTVMADLFARAEGGRRRCLLVHGLESVHVEALRDLVEVFREHVDLTGPSRCFNLLLAGSHEAPFDAFRFWRASDAPDDAPSDEDAGDHLPAPGDAAEAIRVELEDFAPKEAVEALVEHMGPQDPHRLASVVALVGGVPALLDALGAGEARQLTEVLSDRESLWRALGPVAEELRSALDIVNADPSLSNRLERLARAGSLPAEPARDAALVRAGLVRQRQRRDGPHTEVRAPWFSDLVMSA